MKRAPRVARAPKKRVAAAAVKECLISRLTLENLHDIFRRVDFHARSVSEPHAVACRTLGTCKYEHIVIIRCQSRRLICYKRSLQAGGAASGLQELGGGRRA